MQPVIEDEYGALRFKQNKIVDDLLEFSQPRGFGLNQMSGKNYSNEDRQQFAQLLGYSVSGYGNLSYVDDVAYTAARAAAEGVDERDAVIAHLRETINEMRIVLRGPIARLYDIHPDNLFESASD